MRHLYFPLIIVLTLHFIGFSTISYSQTNKQIREGKKARYRANNLMEENPPRYRKSLNLYLTADSFLETTPELHFNIAICYLNTINKTKAIPHLEALLRKEPDFNEELKFLLARAYHLNLQFDKAITYYKKYRRERDDDQLNESKEMLRICADIVKPARRIDPGEEVEIKNLGQIINKRIKECKTGKELVADSLDIQIINLGEKINSPYPEYAPILSADESRMFFTSRRPNTTGGKKDPVDGQYMEDIYRSDKTDGTWEGATNVGPPVCTPKHESAIGLSADGQTLFLYKYDQEKKGEIYISKLKGEQWSKPERFAEPINSDYHEKSISISGDEQTVYFVSTRPGGHGGRDIYKCEKNEEGEWGKAQNLGPTINTPYNEDGVFLHPSGQKLYFSSRAHNTMGGYDIFKSTKQDTGWSEPENIGFPINTPDDDVFFVLSASGKLGYYASIRDGGYGENDLYKIKMPQQEKMAKMESKKKVETEEDDDMSLPGSSTKPTNPLTILKGTITDAFTGDSLKAKVKVVDNEKDKVISTLNSNSETGRYLVTLPSGKNYGISIEKKGYAFHSENFDIPATQGYQEIIKNIELQPIKAGTKIVLNNIFFDYDKASLRSESKPELQRVVEFLNKFSELKVEIGGHTDSKGNASYNKKLSERRAQSVVDYLVEHGIAKNRVKAKGYGESQPIAPNKKPSGADNPKGRQMNRRVELEILNDEGEKVASSKENISFEEKVEEFGKDESLKKGLIYSVQIGASKDPLPPKYFKSFDKVLKYKEENMFKYMVGKFTDYQAAKKYSQEVKNKGIEGAFIVAFKDGEKIPVKKARQTKK